MDSGTMMRLPLPTKLAERMNPASPTYTSSFSSDDDDSKHKFSDFKTLWNCVVRLSESARSSTDAFRRLAGNGSSLSRCATFRALMVSVEGSGQILNSKRFPFSSSSCHKSFDKKIPVKSGKRKLAADGDKRTKASGIRTKAK